MRLTLRLAATAAAAAVLVPLAACGGDDPQDDTADPGSAAAPGQTDKPLVVDRPDTVETASPPSVLTTPSPDAAQAGTLVTRLRAAFPGLATDRAVDDAVATCTELQRGTESAALVRATTIRFSGQTTMTEDQARDVLDVVRGEPWCT